MKLLFHVLIIGYTALVIVLLLCASRADAVTDCTEILDKDEAAFCMDKADLQDLVSDLILFRLRALQDPEKFKRDFEDQNSELYKSYFRTMEKLAMVQGRVATRCLRMAKEAEARGDKDQAAYYRRCYRRAMEVLKGLGLE